MELGVLYFAEEEFYQKFHQYGVLDGNPDDGHGRPCCYLFKLCDEDKLFWMVPISSKIEKYQIIYDRSFEKYGKCDNLSFGYVLGVKKAFLVQNMFPITESYIKEAYINKENGKPVMIADQLMSELRAKARKKYNLSKCGKQLGFSQIDVIERILRQELQDSTNQA